MGRSDISFLQNIRVASPCLQPWEAMQGDERARFCNACKQNVYNLSEMTEDEATALIRSHEGRLCVRYYERRDGTILTKDCAVGVKAVANQKRRKMTATATAAATLAAGAWGLLRSTESYEVMGVIPTRQSNAAQAQEQPLATHEVMGEIALPTPNTNAAPAQESELAPTDAPPPYFPVLQSQARRQGRGVVVGALAAPRRAR